MSKTDMTVLMFGIFAVACFAIFAVYANTIGEMEPSKRGYVQEVRELSCTPRHEVVWVKKDNT